MKVALTLFCLLLLLAGCRQGKYPAASMSPTIRAGERVTVDYTAYKLLPPARWDVVAFEPPVYGITGNIWLMRIVALPGETVAFRSGGITVDGKPLAPPPRLSHLSYVSLDDPALANVRKSITSPYVVPAGSYFVLGDNSLDANDSRMWGAVARKNIVGKVPGK